MLSKKSVFHKVLRSQSMAQPAKNRQNVSVSFRTQTRSSLAHNNREMDKLSEKNKEHINESKISENVILVQNDLKESYEKIFSMAVWHYNRKQKRADRQIKDYFDKVSRDKTLDIQREFIAQFGEVGDDIDDEEKKELLQEFYNDFEEKFPNLVPYNAVIHMDEATPHLHLNVIPVAEGYKQGMEKRPSFGKALENMGYGGKSNFKDFRADVENLLVQRIEQHGYERKVLGEKRPYIKPSQYRKLIEEAKDKARVIRAESQEEGLEALRIAQEDAKRKSEEIIADAKIEAQTAKSVELERLQEEQLQIGLKFHEEVKGTLVEDESLSYFRPISRSGESGLVPDKKKYSLKDHISSVFEFLKLEAQRLAERIAELAKRERAVEDKEQELELREIKLDDRESYVKLKEINAQNIVDDETEKADVVKKDAAKFRNGQLVKLLKIVPEEILAEFRDEFSGEKRLDKRQELVQSALQHYKTRLDEESENSKYELDWSLRIFEKADEIRAAAEREKVAQAREKRQKLIDSKNYLASAQESTKSDDWQR